MAEFNEHVEHLTLLPLGLREHILARFEENRLGVNSPLQKKLEVDKMIGHSPEQ